MDWESQGKSEGGSGKCLGVRVGGGGGYFGLGMGVAGNDVTG